jgi:hypothetical protein
VKDVPELELNSGQFAQYWKAGDGNAFIRMEEPGEDFNAYTDYCFDKAGHLVYLRFELRTAWGWGFREYGPIANRILTLQKSEFFSTKTEEPIAEPEQASEVPEALKPHLYMREPQLPFSKLLSR